MHKAFAVAAFLSVIPVAAFGSAGYGGGGGSFGMAPGMQQGPGMEDYVTALKLMNKGQFDDALPFLRKALRNMPGNADILNYLGFSSRMVGKFDDSLDYYQRALRRDPDHKGAHEYLGELYLQMHQLDNAKGQLAELVRICPTGCEERALLTKAIAAYEAAGSGTPQTAAAPAQAAAPATAPAAAQAPAPATAPAPSPSSNATPQQ